MQSLSLTSEDSWVAELSNQVMIALNAEIAELLFSMHIAQHSSNYLKNFPDPIGHLRT